MVYLGRAQGTPLWDLARISVHLLGVDRGTGCLGGFVTPGHVNHVQFATSGLLSDEFLGGIVRDVISIDDVVVPVPVAKLESIGALEAESSLPAARFG